MLWASFLGYSWASITGRATRLSPADTASVCSRFSWLLSTIFGPWKGHRWGWWCSLWSAALSSAALPIPLCCWKVVSGVPGLGRLAGLTGPTDTQGLLVGTTGAVLGHQSVPCSGTALPCLDCAGGEPSMGVTQVTLQHRDKASPMQSAGWGEVCV